MQWSANTFPIPLFPTLAAQIGALSCAENAILASIVSLLLCETVICLRPPHVLSIQSLDSHHLSHLCDSSSSGQVQSSVRLHGLGVYIRSGQVQWSGFAPSRRPLSFPLRRPCSFKRSVRAGGVDFGHVTTATSNKFHTCMQIRRLQDTLSPKHLRIRT